MSFEALRVLAHYPIFLLYRTEPLPGGKTKKVPVSPITGRDVDPTDSTHWLTLDKAFEAMEKFHLGLALSLDPQYKLFCVDIDECAIEGGWNDTALVVLQWFPGALVEVSHSNRGIHVFGSYKGELPPHATRTRNTPFELYSRLRFIALTGTHMQGNPLVDCTEAVTQMISTYLPRGADKVEISDAWTTEPVVGYEGPGDDDELLRHCHLQRPTIRNMMGGKLTFKEIWENDVEAIAAAFPTTTPGQPFNASSVDLALANHLHYFTGGNCERVKRLMMRSPHVREKWEREDYLNNTILKTKHKESYYRTREGATAPTPRVYVSNDDDTGEEVPLPPPNAMGQILFVDQQVQLFKDCIYVEDVNMVLSSDGVLLNQAQFNARYSGYKFPTEIDGSKPTTKAWDAYVLSQIHPFPKVRGVHFAPKLPPLTIIRDEGHEYVNSWRPLKIKRRAGDIQPFLTHLKKKHPIETDQNILLAYFAFLVQHIGTKAQWAPLLQGAEGDGKTFFSRALEYALGKRYTHWPKASEIDSRFNEAFYGKLLICVEDVKITESKESMWETLKPMITNDRIEIEGKGQAKVTREVCFNFILNSNHQDGVRKTANDRRLAPFFGAQQFAEDLLRDGMNAKYFIDLYKWAEKGGHAAIAHFLQHYEIPDELNPAIGSIRAPVTSSTKDAIFAGSGVVEQEIQECIAIESYGFCGGFISMFALNDLVVRIGRGHALSAQKRHYILRQLGYTIPEALLPNGSVKHDLPMEGRTKLYVKLDNPVVFYKDEKLVREAYLQAQQASIRKTGT